MAAPVAGIIRMAGGRFVLFDALGALLGRRVHETGLRLSGELERIAAARIPGRVAAVLILALSRLYRLEIL